METEAHDDAHKDDEKLPQPVVRVNPDGAPGEKNQPRQQPSRLSVVNSFVNVAGVVGVAGGVWVAIGTLDSINESVDVAKDTVEAQVNQLTLSREQFTATRDALRLEQRAWLGYAGFTLQSKKNTTADPWENREISDSGDIARFRVSVVNSGRTPALNVTLSMGTRISDFAVVPCPAEQASSLAFLGSDAGNRATEGDTLWVNYKPSHFSSRSTDF